jgi:hypothetical protein
MLTLERIRQTQEQKESDAKKRKDNYKSPSGFIIVSRFLKERNMEILENFANENNLGAESTEMLKTKYHKLNYYTPNVVVQLADEEKQIK